MAKKAYIERNNVISHKRPFTEFDEGGWSCKVQAVAVEDIQNIPAADVAPVRHGYWIEDKYGSVFECSECGYVTDYLLTNYCPECGALMDGKENENDQR